MGEVKRGSDRRDEAGRKGENRRKTNLSVESEHRKGSRREGPRRNPASDRKAGQ
jgi:hypothetical protein